MARARNIKASIMDNENLAELEPLARLLFIYLWMLADREGRLEDRPKRIAAQALAYDRDADVDAMLDGLQKSGFIVRYVADEVACIQIVSFIKHQSPHVRESASTLPRIGQTIAKASPRPDLGTDKASPRSPEPGFLNPDCGILNPDCGILIVGKDAEAPTAIAGTPPVKTKKIKAVQTGWPEEFEVSVRVVRWAKEKGYDRLTEHFEAFKRKCFAKGYKNVSWDDAFMEAVREDWAKLRGRTVNGAAPPANHESADELESRAAIEKIAFSKGLAAWNGINEQWPVYKSRVLRAPRLPAIDLIKLSAIAAQHQSESA